MTALRTYPPNSYLVKRKVTLTPAHFGHNYITIPFEYLDDATINDAYGHVANYDHRIDLFGHNDPAFQTLTHFDYSKRARFFRPAATQLWDGATLHKTGGIAAAFNGGAPTGMGTFGELLLTLDFWHSKGCKCCYVMTVYNIYSTLSFWGHHQMSQAHEDNITAYFEALLTDTTTSPLGYTFANHPALQSVELGNEATGSSLATLATDPVGNVKANTARIARQIFDNYRSGGLAVEINGISGIGGVQAYYQSMFGGNSVSQATAAAVTATVGGASTAATRMNKVGHGLVVGDMGRLEAGTTGVSSFSESTEYYVVNRATNTYQLSLTNGGAAITDTVSDIFEVSTRNKSASPYTETYNWRQPVTTNAVLDMSVSSSTFTQASHALQNGMIVRLRRVPNTNGGATPVAWKTTGPVYASLVRWFYVKTVVDANNVELAWNPAGATADFGANVINVRFFKSTPAELYGEDGQGKFYSDFSNLESHHHYGSADTYAEMTAVNNSISSEKVQNDRRALAIAFLSFQKFGARPYGNCAFSTDDFVTFTYKAGVKDGRKVMFNAASMPAGINKYTVYYMSASDKLNNKCKLCLTYADAIANTNFVDITTTNASINAVLMHPWYGERKPKWIDSEQNFTVSASIGAYTSMLTLDKQKEVLLKSYLSSLIFTDDGADGCNTSYHYAMDWAGWNGGAVTVTGAAQLLESVGGKLRITLKTGTPSYPISTNERICIKTTTNPIVGTSDTIAASSYKTVAITAISGGSLNVIDTDFDYSGGNVTGVYYTVERYSGASLAAWQWMVTLLTGLNSRVCNLGFIYYHTTQEYAPFVHVEGIGVWYFTESGELKQW